jgi:hypothetical protein
LIEFFFFFGYADDGDGHGWVLVKDTAVLMWPAIGIHLKSQCFLNFLDLR